MTYELPESEMPQWKSHKIVRAAQYKGERTVDSERGDQVLVEINDEGGECWVTVPSAFFGRGAPTKGDYIVIYDDGYKSWSPAKAFEEGYTRVDGTGNVERSQAGNQA